MLCIEQVLLFFFNIVAIGILISENLGKSSSAGSHTSDPHVHADEVRKFQHFLFVTCFSAQLVLFLLRNAIDFA